MLLGYNGSYTHTQKQQHKICT